MKAAQEKAAARAKSTAEKQLHKDRLRRAQEQLRKEQKREKKKSRKWEKELKKTFRKMGKRAKQRFSMRDPLTAFNLDGSQSPQREKKRKCESKPKSKDDCGCPRPSYQRELLEWKERNCPQPSCK